MDKIILTKEESQRIAEIILSPSSPNKALLKAVERYKQMTDDSNNPKYVGSTSDDRTINNVMRHEYKVLSELEKEFMKLVKDKGLEFYQLLDQIESRNDTENTKRTSRAISQARTKIEEAVMWAVKDITQ